MENTKSQLLKMIEVNGYLELAELAWHYKSYENALKMLDASIKIVDRPNFFNREQLLDSFYSMKEKIYDRQDNEI